MPQGPPIKNTSGEGFTVEDCVVAWLSGYLLAGIPWDTSDSSVIQNLHCQKRQDGWIFDDVVVELTGHQGQTNVGCSVKSYSVFGPKGAPGEFVKAAWQQWFDPTSFRQGIDRMTLVACGHSSDTVETWRSIRDAARSIPSSALARRMTEEAESSAKKRRAFESMRCPPEVNSAAHESSDETVKLLASLSLVEHDFGHSGSRSVEHAISLCQQCLEDAVRNEAPSLWKALLLNANCVRTKGGTINLSQIIQSLEGRFLLKAHPSFAREWDTIFRGSSDSILCVASKIGGVVSIDRSTLLKQISEVTGRDGGAVLLGGSGYGKTVLARMWLAESNRSPVWVRSFDLGARGALRSLWELDHSLEQLIPSATTSLGVVVDGLDKCYDDHAFGEVARLLTIISSLTPDRAQFVITCCPDDWERVRGQLRRFGLQTELRSIEVHEISAEELQAISLQLPRLKPLVSRPHLRRLLCWPKVLDVVARHWNGSSETSKWTTESDFVRWFWISVINRDVSVSMRGRTARKLGVISADKIAGSVSYSDFNCEELAALRELDKEEHVEVDDIREVVRYKHDLVADVSRMMELQVQGAKTVAYLRNRLSSPLWHRAIRLLGLDLLEQNADSELWQRLFDQFNESTSGDLIARNLLLEAPVFALDQATVLERLWPVLVVENGALLRRFLQQFLRVATVPDAQTLMQFEDSDLETKRIVSTRYRWPFGHYWIGLLWVLNQHRSEAVRFARRQIAEICLLWLPLRTITSLRMTEAANLCVELAQIYYESDKRHFSGDNESEEVLLCRALLAAAPVLPDAVSDLALRLSGRVGTIPAQDSEDEGGLSRVIRVRGRPCPRPDGPQCYPFTAFRQAFLHGPSSAPFFAAVPLVATEVMFASLLDIPYENDSTHDSFGDLDEHGFETDRLPYRPLFWTSGPFLTFLQIQPSVVID